MNSAFAVTSLHDDAGQDSQSAALINRILQDAVDKQRLFPSAAKLLSFTHHKSDCQNQYSVQTDAGALFIKSQSADFHAQFEAEEACLLRMMATHTIAICPPLAQGSVSARDGTQVSYLILQHIPLAVHGDWFSAGQQLAQMHSHEGHQGYGFECTTWCGQTPQDNRWNSNWADFFVHQRLQPLLQQLEDKGIRIANAQRALEIASQRLADHQPAPALLHGDLWSGNIGFNPDKNLSYPVLFDPAAYFGDAETDLAMTELFGRFPKKFYEGYESVSALRPDYEDRRAVYQLYHLLNHALLFGGSYIAQSEQQIRELR